MDSRLIIIVITIIIIILINKSSYYDHISKWFILSFQVVWFSVLIATYYRVQDFYLPSVQTYVLLCFNVFSFTLGFSLIRIPRQRSYEWKADKKLLYSGQKIVSNKYFITYLLIITGYLLTLLPKYLTKLAVSRGGLADLRKDFFNDNFYGDLFNYINLLFLIPTQIFLLPLSMFCLYKYRKPILIPIFAYLIIYSTLGGGRLDYFTIFLSFIFFSMCITKISFTRIFQIGSLAIVIFCVFSIVTNARLGHSNMSIEESINTGAETTWKHIVGYPCGSIVAFDHAVSNDYMTKSGGPYYGGVTLSGPIQFANMLSKRVGLPIDEPIGHVGQYKQENHVQIGPNAQHNALFTAMLFPYLDFGIAGVVIIPFFFGLFVRSAIRRFYRSKSLFHLILLNQLYIMTIFSILDLRGIAQFSTVFLILFLYFYSPKTHPPLIKLSRSQINPSSR